MPPKRKRAEGQPGPAPTRSSARLAAGAGASATTSRAETKKSAPSAKAGTTSTGTSTQPAAKKARVAQIETANVAQSGIDAGKTGRRQKKAVHNGSVDEQKVANVPREGIVPNGAVQAAGKPEDTHDVEAFGPFDSTNILTLFSKYADEDDSEHIGPAGVVSLCEDADMPMEGVLPVLLAWQLKSNQMGQFSKKEWVDGLNAMRCDAPGKIKVAMSDLDAILYGSSQSKQIKGDVYNKAKFWPYLEDRLQTLRSFHEFIFTYAKGDQRVLEIETAVALLQVSLVRRFQLVGELCDFIKEDGSYKSLTKDVWAMIFDFGKAVKDDLADYNEEDAWPTLIDNFVAWKKRRSQP